MDKKTENKPLKVVKSEKKPNETGGFHFMTSLKIFDPQTKQTFVQKRCD